VSQAVIRVRSRALPFFRPPPLALQPPPGAVLYLDFLGPLIPSFPHDFTTYCGVCDAGSGWGQSWLAHRMAAEIATSSYAKFIAILGAKLCSVVAISQSSYDLIKVLNSSLSTFVNLRRTCSPRSGTRPRTLRSRFLTSSGTGE
jgi:hypothetical protein